MYRIVGDPIQPSEFEGIARGSDGAVVTFFGIVRDRADDGRPVTSLWYEAYESMAVAEFAAIADEARLRFGDSVRVAVVHRVGEVNVGEISVAVFAAAPHRAAAFDACRYAIDQVKLRAPIWKKESYADGGGVWRATSAVD